MRRSRITAVIALASLAHFAGPAPGYAQESSAGATVSTGELAQLKQQLEELNQKVLVLERQKEIEKEAAVEKAKTATVVGAGKDGFTIGSADKAFQLKIGGWTSFDTAWFDQDSELRNSVGDEQDGTGFRSIRLRLSGTVYQNIDFQSEFEFAGQNGQDTPAIFDTYVTLKDIPYGGERKGELRFGHFREPFSMEELTTLPARLFQELSLASTFNPSRNAGIQWSDALIGEAKKERLQYAVGIFKETDNWPSSNDSDEDQGWSVTGRVSGLPYYKYNGERLVHVGVAYSHRNPDGAVVPYAARPETRLGLFRYIDTDKFQNYRLRDARADDVDLLGLELAAIFGPLTLQSEYTLAEVDTTFNGSRSFSGYYVQAGYFLTGEVRPYRHSTGTFDRVTPKKDFKWGKDGGWGAWEAAVRYSHADLSDGGVRGGIQDSYTAGIHWYLNRSTNVSWNYIHNVVDHDLYDGEFDSLQMRVEVAFL
ncbi:MAG: porin [Candidatus Hydrogenedentales bacterium]|jgi:phosphate-selective porin OprO/OprP